MSPAQSRPELPAAVAVGDDEVVGTDVDSGADTEGEQRDGDSLSISMATDT